MTATRRRIRPVATNRGVAPLAKLTRPQSRGYLKRERLLALLDVEGPRRATWIGAPAGAGKTALASSWIAARGLPCIWYRLDAGDSDPATLFHYLAIAGLQNSGGRPVQLPALTPEFLHGLDVFARRFFEQLFSVCRTPFAIVFDNCHEVPSGAPFFSVILPALIESLPDGDQCVSLSRERAPPSLARWSADPNFRQIRWEELSFTDHEALEFAKVATPAAIDSVATCNRWVRGWITGLKLLLQVSPEERRRILASESLMSGGLFEYLAHEVFEHLAAATREILLPCALLADVEPEIASALAGRQDSAEILERLYAERWFIERRALPSGPSYRFHPLLREFLRTRLMRTRDSAGIEALRVHAAELLEAGGHLEAATLVALESNDSRLLARLILGQASQLVAQGRLGTLEQWLVALPESVRDANGWLLYWLGVTHSVRDIALGRSSLERAYERFRTDGDTSGSWLAVASIISYGLLSLGGNPAEEWMATFEELRAQNGGSLPASIELRLLILLQVLVYHRPELPLSRHLVERALAIAPTLSGSDERLAVGTIVVGFLTWRGDEMAAWGWVRQLEADRPRASPLTLATAYFDHWRGILLWAMGEHEQANAVLTDGLERCRQAGLANFEWPYLIHLAMTALSAGDLEAAGRALEDGLRSVGGPDPGPDQTTARGALWAKRAMQLGLAGNGAAAGALAREQLARAGPQFSGSQTAYWRCVLTVALLEAGALDEAADCAAKALESAGHLPSDRWAFEALMLQAGIELERGAEPAALGRLGRALEIGAAREFKNGVSLWQPARAARLLALALRHGIQPDYVRRLIRRRKLPKPIDPVVGAVWPVRLRVQTLGRFALWIDGEHVANANRLPRKPLEVLKALIGLGPGEVSLDSLGGQLWPELEGDAAHNACQVAVHRLRRILGAESAVEITHGAAALNSADTWVDVEAFREFAPRLRAALAAGVRSALEAERFARDLMVAYPAHFLPAEDRAWAVTTRERLRSRFVQLATELSAALEGAGSFQVAVDLSRHAIELDPLVEPFHRALMRALIALREKSAALEAFRRCRELLATNLHVEPACETYELYAQARKL